MFNREKDALQEELEEYDNSKSDVFEENRDLYESKDVYTDNQAENFTAKINKPNPNYFETNNPALLPDERMLWEGDGGNGGASFGNPMLFVRAFAVIWLSITFFAFVSMIVPIFFSTNMSFSFMNVFPVIFLLPFVGVGIFLLKMSFKKSKAHYIVTENRIIITGGIVSRSVKLSDITDIRYMERTANTGTVIINVHNSGYTPNRTGSYASNVIMSGVINPANVYNIICGAIRNLPINK